MEFPAHQDYLATLAFPVILDLLGYLEETT